MREKGRNSMEYIRQTYRVPARRGMRVRWERWTGFFLTGTIVGALGESLRVRIDNTTWPDLVHPLDHLEYLEDKP